MKTKALISFAVTVKLICVFVFAYAKSRFSHDAAHLMIIKLLRSWTERLRQTVWNQIRLLSDEQFDNYTVCNSGFRVFIANLVISHYQVELPLSDELAPPL